MASQHDNGSASTGKRRKTTSGNESTTTSLAACLECRNRKVKCNREMPRCSNCQKSGGPCEFPDPERKSSQTKQLAEDVATVNGRLSTIEQNLAHRMEVLTDLVSQSVKDPRSTRAHSSRISPEITIDHDNSDLEDEPPSGPSSPDSSGTRPYPPSIIVNDGPVERFYGESSTYSHLVRSRNLVEKLLFAGRNRGPNEGSSRRDSIRGSPALPGLVTGDPSVFTEVQRKYDSFTGTSKFKEYFEIDDDKPLELPPRQELEDAIKLFLSDHSLEPPLFRKQTLDNAVDEQYQSSRLEADESWALCFNNIILRSSAWKSRTIRVNSFAIPSVDDNVLSSLLANANRALRQLERFCVLRMVNVQALFLLALVARDSIHYNVFERIFDRVCQLAKQMGLHERGVVGIDPTPDDVERQNVLWVLYSVDKQRIFMRGPPCRIYLFECHIQLPQANDSKQKLVTAGLRLACLIEEVYRHLYSPKANRIDTKTRQNNVKRLNMRLENLAHHFEDISTSPEQGSSVEMMLSLQLRYAFYVTELLIHSKAMDEQSKAHRLDTSRKALQIVQKLSGGDSVFNGYVAVLERIFCSYSVIAFHEVFDNMLIDPSATKSNDLSLLKAATNALRLLSHRDKPFSYCTRLHKNFTWCTEIATLIHNLRKSVFPDNTKSDGGFFEQSTFDSSGFTRKDAPEQFPVIAPKPTHGFQGDVPMDDGSQHVKGGTSSDSWNSMSSDLNPNDLRFFQNSDIFNNDEFALKADDWTDLFTQPVEVTPGSSAQFQDALKWMFDKGNGLESSL